MVLCGELTCCVAQMLAFSATFSEAALRAMQAIMPQAQRIILTPETTSLIGVEQFYVIVQGAAPAWVSCIPGLQMLSFAVNWGHYFVSDARALGHQPAQVLCDVVDFTVPDCAAWACCGCMAQTQARHRIIQSRPRLRLSIDLTAWPHSWKLPTRARLSTRLIAQLIT